MRLCSICKKRATISEDGVCDVCKGDAGYEIEGYASQIVSQKALIEAQREEAKHQDNYCWVKKNVFQNNV
jgi:hypothetical protein